MAECKNHDEEIGKTRAATVQLGIMLVEISKFDETHVILGMGMALAAMLAAMADAENGWDIFQRGFRAAFEHECRQQAEDESGSTTTH
jgi:hypothetical protein